MVLFFNSYGGFMVFVNKSVQEKNHVCFFLILMLMSLQLGCKQTQRMRGMGALDNTSSLQTTSIENASGDSNRCEVIYPSVYEVMQPALAQVVSLWDQKNGKVKPEVINPTAKVLVEGTKQMLLNIMGMRARPIHPMAFFSVIKDFETSLERRWSGGGSHSFNYSTNNCEHKGLTASCLGLFQINLYSSDKARGLTSNQVTQSFVDICGSNGLNIFGLPGGLDVCATLYWWLKDGKRHSKCAQIPKDRMGSDGVNPCFDAPKNKSVQDEDVYVYAWEPSTFAYAHDYAYVQHNQWWDSYGYDDPWRRLYEGGKAPRGVDYYMGYEHCAAKHYLKKFLPTITAAEKGSTSLEDLKRVAPKLTRWVSVDSGGGYSISEDQAIRTGHPVQLTSEELEGAGKELMRAMVADFAKDINLYPWWYSAWWEGLTASPKPAGQKDLDAHATKSENPDTTESEDSEAYKHGVETRRTAPYTIGP